VWACNPSYSGGIVGGSWSNFSPGQHLRPYLKNNDSKKELEVWLKWQSSCPARGRPSTDMWGRGPRLWHSVVPFCRNILWDTVFCSSTAGWEAASCSHSVVPSGWWLSATSYHSVMILGLHHTLDPRGDNFLGSHFLMVGYLCRHSL
jgi:hypothetical protein